MPTARARFLMSSRCRYRLLGDWFWSSGSSTSSIMPRRWCCTTTTLQKSTIMCGSVASAARPATAAAWANSISIFGGRTAATTCRTPRSFASLLSSSSVGVLSSLKKNTPSYNLSRGGCYFSTKTRPKPKTAAKKKKKAKKRRSEADLPDPNQPRRPIVAILGPPNSGKSTLFNKLLSKSLNRSYRLGSDKKPHRNKHALLGRRPTHGQALAIVSEWRGTTRDARECIGAIGPVEFQLWDTAGVEGAWTAQQFLHAYSQDDDRHSNDPAKPHIQRSLQYAMMKHTFRAAQQADLVLLLMDARNAGVTADLYETGKWLRQVSRTVNQNNNNDDSTTTTTLPPRTKPKIVLVANKLEGNQWNYPGSPILDHLDEAERRLGFGPPILLSAIHGDGIADLAFAIQDVQEEIVQYEYGDLDTGSATAVAAAVAATSGRAKATTVDESDWEEDEDDDFDEEDEFDSDDDIDSDGTSESKSSDDSDSDSDQTVDEITSSDGTQNTETKPKEKPLQLAILGRQNVGKSTLVNALLGHERCLVGPTPGLTRDAITSVFYWNNRPVQIVDTAGIRKRPQRDHSTGDIEDLAVQDALRAMKVADVAVLVIDAGERMLRRQELAIADAILKEGRSIVVAANKMDLIVQVDYSRQEFVDAVRTQLEGRFPLLRQTPIVAMSSLYDVSSVEDLMPVVFNARDRWQRKLSTAQLNRWIRDLRHGSPSRVHGQQVKIKYIIQTKGRPPTFLLYCSTDEIPDSYARFLMRHFQDSFEMYGMEVRLIVKKSAPENPFHKEGPGHRKRSGYGLGGREARKKRNIKRLLNHFGNARNKEEYRFNMSEMSNKRKRQGKTRRQKVK